MWLLEAARLGNAPLALVMEEIDPALATGALLAQIMLERSIPVVDRLGVSPTDLFRTGDIVEVDADRGEVRKVQ
jgi:predicted aconitase with swiveling domain